MCSCLLCAPYWSRALTGNQTGDPWVHRPALSPLSHSGQGCTFNTNKHTQTTASKLFPNTVWANTFAHAKHV